MSTTKLAGVMKDSGWVLISTTDCSTTASVTVTGLDSTYDTYALVISACVPDSDGESFEIRVGDSGGVDSGASDYAYHYINVAESAATYGGANSTGADSILLSGGTGSDTGEGLGALLYLHNPGDSPMAPCISGTVVRQATNGNVAGGHVIGFRQAVITLDRVYFAYTSGNIETGRISVYGVAHA